MIVFVDVIPDLMGERMGRIGCKQMTGCVISEIACELVPATFAEKIHIVNAPQLVVNMVNVVIHQ